MPSLLTLFGRAGPAEGESRASSPSRDFPCRPLRRLPFGKLHQFIIVISRRHRRRVSSLVSSTSETRAIFACERLQLLATPYKSLQSIHLVAFCFSYHRYLREYCVKIFPRVSVPPLIPATRRRGFFPQIRRIIKRTKPRTDVARSKILRVSYYFAIAGHSARTKTRT